MTYPRLIWRNLWRHPLRMLFTTLSIALSIFLVCAVLTLPGAIDSILAQATSNIRLTVHHKAGLSYWLPYAYVNKVRNVPGVLAVNHYSWFGGVYDEPKNMFPNFAIDPETVAQVWPDYRFDPVALERFRKIRNACLVGEQTMRKFSWKVGDEITLKSSVYPVSLSFQIVGVIPRHDNPLMWFNRQYLEEAMEPYGGLRMVGWIWVRVAGPEDVDRVIVSIDEIFKNSQAQVAAETETSFFSGFFSSFQGLIRVVLIVGFLVVGAVVLIAANTAAMGVRERIPEIAMLKSLGFQRRPILLALMAESALQALVGGLLGAGAAYGIFTALAAAGKTGAMPFLGPLASFHISPVVAGEGVAIALSVGLIAGFVPAWNGARLNVVEALRRLF